MAENYVVIVLFFNYAVFLILIFFFKSVMRPMHHFVTSND